METTAVTARNSNHTTPARRIDRTVYSNLLSNVLPRVIRTERENERVLEALEKLDFAERPLTPEEEELSELMTLLIEDFEEKADPLGHATPLGALQHFMEARNLRQRDLIPIFGSSSVVSAVINGKRSISKTHARKLAEFFHVSTDLFI